MYMSLEQIKKIPDATTRKIALSLHKEQQQNQALRKNILNDANAKRQRRIELLQKRLPAATREKLAAQIPNAKLSLADDGTIDDPLAPMLDILESGISDLPRSLMDMTAVTELPHPQEFTGQMSEERRKEVIEEFESNAGAYAAG